jgi:hypothetical protein
MSDRPKDEKKSAASMPQQLSKCSRKIKKRNYVNRMDFFRLFFKNGAFGNI